MCIVLFHFPFLISFTKTVCVCVGGGIIHMHIRSGSAFLSATFFQSENTYLLKQNVSWKHIHFDKTFIGKVSQLQNGISDQNFSLALYICKVEQIQQETMSGKVHSCIAMS